MLGRKRGAADGVLDRRYSRGGRTARKCPYRGRDQKRRVYPTGDDRRPGLAHWRDRGFRRNRPIYLCLSPNGATYRPLRQARPVRAHPDPRGTRAGRVQRTAQRHSGGARGGPDLPVWEQDMGIHVGGRTNPLLAQPTACPLQSPDSGRPVRPGGDAFRAVHGQRFRNRRERRARELAFEQERFQRSGPATRADRVHRKCRRLPRARWPIGAFQVGMRRHDLSPDARLSAISPTYGARDGPTGRSSSPT